MGKERAASLVPGQPMKSRTGRGVWSDGWSYVAWREMSYSDRLQLLRDQNKQLLQKLREERLQIGAPTYVSEHRESSYGLNLLENRKAVVSPGNNARANRFEQVDSCFMRNSRLKYKTGYKLLSQEMKNDDQPSEIVMTESLLKREESRAALCAPSMHKARKQIWTLNSGDGTSMEPVRKPKAVSNVEKNRSTSAVLPPEESLIEEETLGQKWNLQNLDPQSSRMSEYFESSTPFTKRPPSTGCRQSNSHHDSGQQLDVGNDRQSKHIIRDAWKPKSILLEPHNKMVKADTGHVTFLSSDEENNLNAEVQSVQPLLGYDWIAGLIDVDSPLSEKSEQYFLELQNFRRVNREECVHQEFMEEGELNDKVTDQEELSCNGQIHQCTHSYRVNNRLFAVPLELAATCPVCKTPKSKRPHTMEEPAYIRVSFPRSTLLPPHEYKPHRRRSFNPIDSLSLPSHCLMGWESSLPLTAPIASTLDLRCALEHKSTSVPLTLNSSNMSAAAVSRVAGGTRSDELLDFSHSTQYQFQKLEQRMKLR
ncbi:uncharacterized protein miip isoform X2 [Narcine bancroftii]|uniref:uncharacterized protein miip isoform X2 n=1 Tax=Narcine bancroftii TaxID=1343680 RepID=UPI003831E7B5